MSSESKYINNQYQDFFEKSLKQSDPDIYKAINDELIRQQNHIELIASENIVSQAVLEAQGSVLTNKYAEGYPGKRYYNGCEHVDVAEEEKYTEFVKDFEHTYFKEVYDVLSKRYKLGRMRLLLKEPRSTLSWHRDPEPRLHIPIYTNPGAIMVVDKVAQHMPADGSVWITNNTKYHNAFNGGEENRVHLVACVLDYKFN